MQFELRITGDDPGDLASILAHLTEARQVVLTPTEALRVQLGRGTDTPVNGGGLPLTQEAFATAARASVSQGAPEPPASGQTPPKPRGRPRKDVIGTVVMGAGGEPVAVLTKAEADAPVDEPVDDGVTDVEATVTVPDFPVIKDDPLTPAEQRDKAIALLQSVFGKPQGPVEVRSLQTKFKIKKFNEVPDAMCKDLLNAAQDLHARIMATQG